MAEFKSPLAKLVVAAAKTRFGPDRWQQPTAKLIGIKTSLIQKLVSEKDKRDINPDHAHAIGVAFIIEADKLEAQADKVRSAAMKILKHLEGK